MQKLYPLNIIGSWQIKEDPESAEEGRSTISISLVENTEAARVEMHLRGAILPPEDIEGLLTSLYQVSDSYDTIMVYLNTPGGSLYSLVEIMAALQKFKTIITVACGTSASAGFLLWCSGNIRVVQPYASLMCHREVYNTGMMKTSQHLDLVNHANDTYAGMTDKLCAGILTPEEMQKSTITEVFLSGDQMIERGKAISWAQFIAADRVQLQPDVTVCHNGIVYDVLPSGDLGYYGETDDEYWTVAADEVLYGVPDASRVRIT